MKHFFIGIRQRFKLMNLSQRLVLSLVLVVIAIAPVLGAIADRGGARLRLLMAFTLLGSVATVALPLVPQGQWWLAAGLRGALLGAALVGLPYALLYVVAGWVYGRGKALGIGDVWTAGLVGLVTGFPAATVALLTAALTALLVVVVLLGLGKRGRRDAVATVPFLAFGALVGVLWSSGVVSAMLRSWGL